MQQYSCQDEPPDYIIPAFKQGQSIAFVTDGRGGFYLGIERDVMRDNRILIASTRTHTLRIYQMPLQPMVVVGEKEIPVENVSTGLVDWRDIVKKIEHREGL